jgi:hypothetical protein
MDLKMIKRMMDKEAEEQEARRIAYGGREPEYEFHKPVYFVRCSCGTLIASAECRLVKCPNPDCKLSVFVNHKTITNDPVL